MSIKVKQGLEIVPINSKDDVRAALVDMYPENRIPAEEFLSNLSQPDQSVLKHHVGIERSYYGIDEITDLIWRLSNYEQSAD